MTDRDKVYTKMKKTIKQMLKLDHQGQIVTLAMMITGIIMSRKAQLSTMSSEVPGKKFQILHNGDSFKIDNIPVEIRSAAEWLLEE
jgi:hypothetical protein